MYNRNVLQISIFRRLKSQVNSYLKIWESSLWVCWLQMERVFMYKQQRMNRKALKQETRDLDCVWRWLLDGAAVPDFHNCRNLAEFSPHPWTSSLLPHCQTVSNRGLVLHWINIVKLSACSKCQHLGSFLQDLCAQASKATFRTTVRVDARWRAKEDLVVHFGSKFRRSILILI